MTIPVEDEVEIRRARPDVFAFVSDHEHLPGWTVGVKRVRRTSNGPVGVGTTYVVVGKILGRRVEATYELIAYDPETMFAGRMTSRIFSFEETYRFDDHGGATRVRLRAEARPGRRLRLLGPLLGTAMRRQVRADHRRLKSVLERRSAAPAARGNDQRAQERGEEERGDGDAGEELGRQRPDLA